MQFTHEFQQKRSIPYARVCVFFNIFTGNNHVRNVLSCSDDCGWSLLAISKEDVNICLEIKSIDHQLRSDFRHPVTCLSTGLSGRNGLIRSDLSHPIFCGEKASEAAKSDRKF